VVNPKQGMEPATPNFDVLYAIITDMTNSTPTLLIWLVQYRKYLDLVQQDLLEQAELVKAEINEALPDAELCWEDLERAAQNLKQ
jgi:hypothetical protein